MIEIPRIVRRRLQAEPAGDAAHPDANLLSAFAERALSEDERAQVLQHLGHCAQCREIVTLALPQEAEAELGVTTGRAAAPWWRWPMLRWGALAAGVVIVATAVLVPKVGERKAQVSTFSGMEQPLAKESRPPGADEADAKQEATPSEPARAVTRAPLAAAKKPRTSESKAEFARDARKDVANEKQAFVDATPPVPKERSMDRLEAAPEPESRTPSREEQVTLAVEDRAAASPPTGQILGRTRSKAALPAPQQGHLGKKPEAMPTGTAGAFRSAQAGVRWSISAEGAVQRSLDGGRTWATVPIAEGIAFRAVSVVRTDVWAGGASGALYHSSDGGEHWSRIAVRRDGTALSGDIVRIEFSDPARGILVTSTSETWITNDAGRTWQRR